MTQRPAIIYLSTPCAVCHHPYNWHTPGGMCQADDDVTRCDCIAFAVPGDPS